MENDRIIAVLFDGTSVGLGQAAPEVSGVSFEGKTEVYDGEIHTLTVSGNTEGMNIEYVDNSATDAGVYSAKAIITKSGFRKTELSAVLVIEKAEQVIEAETEFVYTGEKIYLEAMLESGDGAIIYENNLGFIEKGSYAVTAIAAETANYKRTEKEFNLKTLEGFDISVGGLSHVYDGSDKLPELSGCPQGALVCVTDKDGNSANFVNAGIYSFTVTVSKENYKDFSYKGVLTIEKARAFITAEMNQEILYTGMPIRAEAQLNHNETELIYSLQPVEEGSYTITVSAAESENYLAATPVTVYLKITNLKRFNVTFDSCTSTYTGEDLTPEATIENAMSIPGLSVEYLIKDSQNNIVNKIVNVGTYKVSLFVAADGYQTYFKQIDVEIINGQMSVSMLPETVQYDGTAKILSVSNAPAGANFVYEYKKDGTVVTEAVNAGEYSVKATVTCANFEDVVLNATLTIIKANSIITARNDIIRYDGQEITSLNGASIDNGEQTLMFSFKLAGEEVPFAKEVGVYEVTVSAAESANYNAPTPVVVYLTIENSGIDGITFENKTVSYNGLEQTIEITGELKDGFIVSYKNNCGIAAGTYAATAYITETATGEMAVLTATLTISPVDLVISAGEYVKIQAA